MDNNVFHSFTLFFIFLVRLCCQLPPEVQLEVLVSLALTPLVAAGTKALWSILQMAAGVWFAGHLPRQKWMSPFVTVLTMTETAPHWSL